MCDKSTQHFSFQSVFLFVDSADSRVFQNSRAGNVLEYVSKSDWSGVASAVAEANATWRYLLLLVIDDCLSSLLKWTGIIDSIEICKTVSRVHISYVENVAHLQLHAEVPDQCTGKFRAKAGLPIMLPSPLYVQTLICQHVGRLREKYNPFYHDQCLFIPITMKTVNRLPFDEDGIQTLLIPSPWEAARSVFLRVEELGKVLNVIFADIDKNLEIACIAVIDSVEILDGITQLHFGYAEKFLHLNRPVPFSTVHLSEHGRICPSSQIHEYGICEAPWYVSVHLDRVFCTPSQSDFKSALADTIVTKEEREILWRHFIAEEQILSMHQLARLMRYRDSCTAHLRYSQLAARIAALIEFPMGACCEHMECVAFKVYAQRSQEPLWKMRPELARALLELRWIGYRGDTYQVADDGS